MLNIPQPHFVVLLVLGQAMASAPYEPVDSPRSMYYFEGVTAFTSVRLSQDGEVAGLAASLTEITSESDSAVRHGLDITYQEAELQDCILEESSQDSKYSMCKPRPAVIRETDITLETLKVS